MNSRRTNATRTDQQDLSRRHISSVVNRLHGLSPDTVSSTSGKATDRQPSQCQVSGTGYNYVIFARDSPAQQSVRCLVHSSSSSSFSQYTTTPKRLPSLLLLCILFVVVPLNQFRYVAGSGPGAPPYPPPSNEDDGDDLDADERGDFDGGDSLAVYIQKALRAPVLIYGRVLRTFQDHRLSSVYTAEMEVYCTLKGAKSKLIVNITEAGHRIENRSVKTMSTTTTSVNNGILKGIILQRWNTSDTPFTAQCTEVKGHIIRFVTSHTHLFESSLEAHFIAQYNDIASYQQKGVVPSQSWSTALIVNNSYIVVVTAVNDHYRASGQEIADSKLHDVLQACRLDIKYPIGISTSTAQKRCPAPTPENRCRDERYIKEMKKTTTIRPRTTSTTTTKKKCGNDNEVYDGEEYTDCSIDGTNINYEPDDYTSGAPSGGCHGYIFMVLTFTASLLMTSIASALNAHQPLAETCTA